MCGGRFSAVQPCGTGAFARQSGRQTRLAPFHYFAELRKLPVRNINQISVVCIDNGR